MCNVWRNLKEFGSRDAEIKIVEINNVEKERNIGVIEGGEEYHYG